MVTRSTVILIVSAVTVTAALAVGYWFVLRSQPELCSACHRQIDERSRAVVEVSDKTEEVCCVRCGLTIGRQEHQKVRLVEVTDYNSRKPLAPETAYYVEGSRVMVCEHHKELVDQSKRPYEVVFDRCMPSTFAFSRLQDADAFASNNGGKVLDLSQVIDEAESKR